MCGILGQIKIGDNRSFATKERFVDALNLQKHRGPDDFGVYNSDNIIFGHRRLSIVDLDPRSKQPMISEDENYILVFNGEIYNFKEIKDDLINKEHKFKTAGDTEVILKAYIEYGIDCIQQFIGMFAFALHDKKKNKTYIVRDRLGIKPLYYAFDKGIFTFSSEIKSILHLDTIKRDLNIEAVSSYLSFRYPILNDTFFSGVESLSPAHYIEIKNGKKKIVEYWNLAKQFELQKVDRGEEFYIKKLRELLESAVKYRMIADVPVGAFLSGGVDSSVVTALMSNLSKNRISTFTIGFEEDGFNEFDFAKKVAEKYNTKHREILLSGTDYMNTMNDLIKIKDAPLSVPNEVPLYLMSKELSKYIKVVLSGEGADEIFGGYGRIFRSPYDLERIKKIDVLNLPEEEKKELAKNFFDKYGIQMLDSEISHFMNIYSYNNTAIKKSVLNNKIDIDKIELKLKNKFLYYFDELQDKSYYNKIMYAFEKIHIVGLLQRVDVTTMAASIEARVPFVDHRLVEFAFTIPVKYKLKWKNEGAKSESKLFMSDKISERYDTPKYILKKAYEDLLPKSILYRKKVGFPVPLEKWFNSNFNEYAKSILLSDVAKARNLYNIDDIEEILDSKELMSQQKNAMLIWMLINIELFNKYYFN